MSLVAANKKIVHVGTSTNKNKDHVGDPGGCSLRSPARAYPVVVVRDSREKSRCSVETAVVFGAAQLSGGVKHWTKLVASRALSEQTPNRVFSFACGGPSDAPASCDPTFGGAQP